MEWRRAPWARRQGGMAEALTGKRQQILEYIGDKVREDGYPPSVREIGQAVGLT